MEPQYGNSRVSVPRMVVAQFDSIRCQRIYKKFFPEVLRSLDIFLSSCNREAWFTVFLATFLLLHQAADTSRDRYRHSKDNGEVNPRVRSLPCNDWNLWLRLTHVRKLDTAPSTILSRVLSRRFTMAQLCCLPTGSIINVAIL